MRELSNGESGSSGVGLTNPLEADLDAAGFSIVSTTGDLTLEPHTTGEVVVKNTAIGTGKLRMYPFGAGDMNMALNGATCRILAPDGNFRMNFGSDSLGMRLSASQGIFLYQKTTLSGEIKHTGSTFGLYSTTPATQPVHVADPTDLASCITAITAINAKDALLGLTAAS